MKTVLSNARFWSAGLVVAAVGVALARGAAAGLTGSARVTAVLAGEFLGLAGLLVICVGVSRRLHRAPPEEKSP